MQSTKWRLDEAFRPMMPQPGGFASRPVQSLIERWVLPPGIVRAVGETSGADGAEFASALLQRMGVRYEAAEGWMERIPAAGAAIVVSNHPFGILDGMVLLDCLSKGRKDVKFLANAILAAIPAIRDVVLPVDVMNDSRPAASLAGVRRAVEWLKGGGLLAVFPAGEVSHLNWKEWPVADPEWSDGVARLARMAKAPVVPVYVSGTNSAGFQIAGVFHPRLRTLSLARELENKRGRMVRLRFGSAIAPKDLDRLGDDFERAGYLRFRTYLLSTKAAGSGKRRGGQAQLAMAESVSRMEQEVSRLVPVCSFGNLAAYRARAEEIPTVLREIGRLREETFRDAGEGTGGSRDLDDYDAWYRHLFIWNEERREIAGAYRLGSTAEILPSKGVKGLYTYTLFRLDARLFDKLGPAFELGRSFVRKEYQRQYAPLALLWKAICATVAARPEHAVLFGAVSISRDYAQTSRDLMVAFLNTLRDEPLARYVQARRPYRLLPGLRWHERQARRFITNIESLSGTVSDIEADGKGVPVLLRQYLKLGGRTLGVSVDPGFSNVVDALIAVDLRRTPGAALARHMGAGAAQRFLTFHGVRAEPIPPVQAAAV